MVRREPVLQAVRAAGVLGDVAADRADLLRRRVGRVVEALVLDGACDVEVRDARVFLWLDFTGAINGDTVEWAHNVELLAELPNVSCKLSGLVIEADWGAWRADELVPYYRRALDWFGPSRTMFGSDWPLCLVAADYGAVLELVLAALDGLDDAERDAVLGGNATRVYRL